MNYLRNVRVYHQHAIEQASQNNVEARRHPDEFRIQSLLSAIQRGKFKYYVSGGYSRGRGLRLEPLKIAKFHKLNINDCLFEIKDPRIEAAVDQFGLQRVTPSSRNRGPNAIPETPIRRIEVSAVIKRGDW